MSFDEIFDLTAGVYFNFFNNKCRTIADLTPHAFTAEAFPLRMLLATR